MARPPAPASPLRPPAEIQAPRTPDLRWIVSPSAVTVWMAINGSFLWIGLMQVPLAAAYPPGPTFLFELIIACQVGFAALLAPLLSRSLATMLVAALSSWPILLLAGGLASRPIPDILLVGSITTAWLLTVCCWTSCFRTVPQQQIVVAVACLISIGCPLLWYLMTEFGVADTGSAFRVAASWTPMILAWNCAGDMKGGWAEALPLTLCLLLGLAIWMTRRCYARAG